MNKPVDFVKGALKAVIAGAAAAIAFATPVVDDGLVASEILGIVGAFIIAFNAVYWVNNTGPMAPPNGPPEDIEGIPEPDPQPPVW